MRLWKLKQEVDSAIHPDTGEIVPEPFRMSGYVPFNGPICVFQVTSSSTLPIVFWNWANQSQNALVNYFNRNAASAMSDETLMKSYTGAVFGAMTVAMGLATFVKRTFSPKKAARLLQFVTFPACVVASSMNCYIVRAPEMDVGVPVLDGQGNDILPGKLSKVAATKGVYETTASRAFLQVRRERGGLNEGILRFRYSRPATSKTFSHLTPPKLSPLLSSLRYPCTSSHPC